LRVRPARPPPWWPEQLLTYGCGRLARDLLADGLLDVLVLSLTPVVAGAGRRLFAVRLFLKPDHT
jgi:dihydrofolate reductase